MEIDSDSSADEFSDNKDFDNVNSPDKDADILLEEAVSDMEEEEKKEMKKDFDPNRWQFGKLPQQRDLGFLAQSGPLHNMLPWTTTPLYSLSLYVPLFFFWDTWALYTIAYAQNEQ